MTNTTYRMTKRSKFRAGDIFILGHGFTGGDTRTKIGRARDFITKNHWIDERYGFAGIMAQEVLEEGHATIAQVNKMIANCEIIVARQIDVDVSEHGEVWSYYHQVKYTGHFDRSLRGEIFGADIEFENRTFEFDLQRNAYGFLVTHDIKAVTPAKEESSDSSDSADSDMSVIDSIIADPVLDALQAARDRFLAARDARTAAARRYVESQRANGGQAAPGLWDQVQAATAEHKIAAGEWKEACVGFALDALRCEADGSQDEAGLAFIEAARNA